MAGAELATGLEALADVGGEGAGLVGLDLLEGRGELLVRIEVVEVLRDNRRNKRKAYLEQK